MSQEHTLYVAAGQSQGSIWALIIPIALLGLFWFIAIRPTRKRQRDMSATQARVTPGARVMTGAGLYGTVAALEDDTVLLEVAPGTQLRYARQAIVKIVEPGEPADDADTDDADDADDADTDDADRTSAGRRDDPRGDRQPQPRSSDGSVS